MALIACGNCGGQISDKALKCPHCGTKQKKKISSVNVGLVLLIVGIALIAAIIVFAILGFDLANQFNYFRNYTFDEYFLYVVLILLPAILFIIAAFKSKTKGIKWLSLSFVVAWLVSFILWAVYDYERNFKPVIDFKNTYTNATALEKLNGKTIKNDKGYYITFKGDNVEVGDSDGMIFQAHVISVDEEGNITTDIQTDPTNAHYYVYLSPYSESYSTWYDYGYNATIYGDDMKYWKDSYYNKDKNKGDFGVVGEWNKLSMI